MSLFVYKSANFVNIRLLRIHVLFSRLHSHIVQWTMNVYMGASHMRGLKSDTWKAYLDLLKIIRYNTWKKSIIQKYFENILKIEFQLPLNILYKKWATFHRNRIANIYFISNYINAPSWTWLSKNFWMLRKQLLVTPNRSTHSWCLIYLSLVEIWLPYTEGNYEGLNWKRRKEYKRLF